MSRSRDDKEFDLVVETYIYAYKINGSYPEGCKATRNRSIRRKASKMILRGSEIFLSRNENGKALVSL